MPDASMGCAIPRGHQCDSRSVDFTELLRWWYGSTNEPTIGDVGTFGGKAWVSVTVHGERCHLNADTTRAGMRRYLELAKNLGPDLPWHVIANQHGKVNKMVVEPTKEPTKGLFLYTASELQAPVML